HLEPRLATSELADRGRAVQRPRQADRGYRQGEPAARRGTDGGKPLADGGDCKSLLDQNALDQLAALLIVIDNDNSLPFRVHLLLSYSNSLASKGYGAKPFAVSLTAAVFRCGFRQSLAGFLDLNDGSAAGPRRGASFETPAAWAPQDDVLS